MHPPSSVSPLLSADDPPPLRLMNVAATGPVVLICDHAGKAVPRRLSPLAPAPAEMSRHIGWDIGAAAVAETLALRLSAVLIAGVYSRLVLDLNRDPVDPTLIPATSDGTEIAFNRGLSAAARDCRLREIFLPYHAAIDARLDWQAARGAGPVLIGVHSFTPEMNGISRPWEIGILWNQDGRLAIPLIEALRRDGVTVGDNEPYTGRLFNYSLNRHGEARGFRHVSIEIRQDLIGDAEGVGRWSDRLLRSLGPLLA